MNEQRDGTHTRVARRNKMQETLRQTNNSNARRSNNNGINGKQNKKRKTETRIVAPATLFCCPAATAAAQGTQSTDWNFYVSRGERSFAGARLLLLCRRDQQFSRDQCSAHTHRVCKCEFFECTQRDGHGIDTHVKWHLFLFLFLLFIG